MSIANVVAMLGSGMSGYLKGRQQKLDEDTATQDQEFKQWQRGQMQEQAARDAVVRGDLSAAGAPVTPTPDPNSSSTGIDPTAAPDAVPVKSGSGFGGVGSDPGAQPAPVVARYTVGGQSGLTPGAAADAAAAANTPGAQAQRMAAAYSKNGQGAMAMQVQREAQQSELAGLGLQQKHLEIANELYDNLLGQQGSHDAIAQFVSNSQHDGQGGALQLQAVPSPDGKTVSYAKVNPDGSLSPTGHTYTNDAAGVDQAQLWLSKATPLSMKIANLHQQASDQLAASKEASEAGERTARSKYYEAIGAAAGIKAEKTGAGKVPLFDRMDESDKIELQNAYKASTEVDSLINKGIEDGSLTKGSDNYNFLTARKAAADLKARNVLSRYADTGSPAATADPLGLRPGGAPAGMAGAAATQAAADTTAGRLIINNEFGGDVGKAQQYVTARRAEAASQNGDAKQIMNSEADRVQRGIDSMKAAATPTPAAAPASSDSTARRVVATPVVDFRPPSGGTGVNARVAAATSKIPALTAAMNEAKANLAAAKSKGPMAVAAARDAWNNAKTALAEANLRAGNTVAEEDN